MNVIKQGAGRVAGWIRHNFVDQPFHRVREEDGPVIVTTEEMLVHFAKEYASGSFDTVWMTPAEFRRLPDEVRIHAAQSRIDLSLARGEETNVSRRAEPEATRLTAIDPS